MLASGTSSNMIKCKDVVFEISVMTKVSSEIPFLWRLSPESGDGYCSVALVVSATSLSAEFKDVTIETDILSLSSGDSCSTNEEVLEWNQEDIALFMALINRNKVHELKDKPGTLKIDLTDPNVIEIIHIVAAAGFGTAYTSGGLLGDSSGLTLLGNCEIGAIASLHTVSGFVCCVVVDLEDDDVICVLLNDISTSKPGFFDQIHRHDLLLVNRGDLLIPEFADDYERPQDSALH